MHVWLILKVDTNSSNFYTLLHELFCTTITQIIHAVKFQVFVQHGTKAATMWQKNRGKNQLQLVALLLRVLCHIVPDIVIRKGLLWLLHCTLFCV